MRANHLFVAITVTCFSAAGWPQSSRAPVAAAQVSTLPNGMEVSRGELHEEITALRDDVLRIRLWRGDAPPEDASWAVLASARHASVPVAAANSAGRYGFRTSTLAVEVNSETLEVSVRDSAGNLLQKDAQPVQFAGNTFRLCKTMPLDEHYFGLGDKAGPLDRRNEAFTLWNTDAYRFQESTDPLYKSIPYFMAFRDGRALGVLLDNTWRSSFDFGRESPGMYTFGAVAGPIDYYVFYGPTPKQVVQTYAWLTGTPPLPPLWSLGFQQSRYSYMTQARVLEVAARLRGDRIPADAIYLDIDFQDHNRPFTVNRSAFPDLAGMFRQLTAENLHAVMITDLHIADPPAEGYFPYDSGTAGDHFVKNPDGSAYVGKVWPGPSEFPDFTRRETRAWWGTLYREFVHDGASGFWNDMNEPSIFDSPTQTMPLDVVHRIDEPGFASRTATHAEIHNVYGMENSRATYEGLRALEPDTRPFVLTRATYAGGQRYAATWTGDNSSSWNHLRMTTPMLENLGLGGFAFSGADVGGYAGTPSPELLTKWFEVGAFQPIDRDHTEKGTGDQEPWAGGPEQEAIRRHFVETRYQLLPYIYTVAEEASRTGLPLERPLFLEFPDATPDRHPIDIDAEASSEFMLGSDLLIAPPQYPEELDEYSVEFPTPAWYDFWTGDKVNLLPPDPPPPGAPDRTIQYSMRVTPVLSQLPVYVRAGAIVPMEPLVQSTSETPAGPLTLRIYAGDSCRGQLYQDDGRSFAFEKGEFLRETFACEVKDGSIRVTIGPRTGTYPAWWKEVRFEIYGWTPSRDRIVLNGTISATKIDHSEQRISFTLADDGNLSRIEVQ
jgi:alpha-glucosidase